jgi:hypothetical protein
VSKIQQTHLCLCLKVNLSIFCAFFIPAKQQIYFFYLKNLLLLLGFIFPAGFANRVVLNKDTTVCLNGGRPANNCIPTIEIVVYTFFPADTTMRHSNLLTPKYVPKYLKNSQRKGLTKSLFWQQ